MTGTSNTLARAMSSGRVGSGSIKPRTTPAAAPATADAQASSGGACNFCPDCMFNSGQF